MMIPPVKALLQRSSIVRDMLGQTPRVFRHGEAPKGESRPYVVWLVIAGTPENTLGEAPSIDRNGIQLDVYATTDAEVEATATAARDQMETATHMTAWRVMPRDAETRLYRISMDFDYWLPREG